MKRGWMILVSASLVVPLVPSRSMAQAHKKGASPAPAAAPKGATAPEEPSKATTAPAPAPAEPSPYETPTGAAAAEPAETATAPAPPPPPKAPVAAPAEPAVKVAPITPPEPTDHEMVVGHLAVGYLGRTSMFIANFFNGTMTATSVPPFPNTFRERLSAPVIGIRYWIGETVGLDAGLGFYMSSGSETTDPAVPAAGASSRNLANPFALILHAGLPLALTSAKHFSFEIVPEFNVGFASRTESAAGTMGADLSESGFHLDAGARFGGEIQFGFMGIPQLSLQGSVGVGLSIDNVTADDQGGRKFTDNRTTFGSTLQSSPWNIFISNVSAFYYF